MSVHSDTAKLVLQAYAGAEVDVLDQLHATDYVEHSPLPGQEPGIAGIRERAMALSCAFYDMYVDAEVLVDHGDTVVLRARCRGVHKGDFHGMPASGRQVEAVGLCVFRFVDGLVAETWSTFEIQGRLGATSARRARDPYLVLARNTA